MWCGWCLLLGVRLTDEFEGRVLGRVMLVLELIVHSVLVASAVAVPLVWWCSFVVRRVCVSVRRGLDGRQHGPSRKPWRMERRWAETVGRDKEPASLPPRGEHGRPLLS